MARRLLRGPRYQRGFIDQYRFGSVGGDPEFANVTFLSHLDADNGSGSVVPEVYAGGSIALQSGASISATQSVFGGKSLRSTTSNGGLYTSTGFSIGTGDATAEFFVRLDGVSSTQVLIDCRPFSTTGMYFGLTAVSAELRYSVNGTARISAAGALTATTWYFIAWSRLGGTSSLYCGPISNPTAPLVGTYTDSLDLLNGDLGIGTSAFGAGGHAGGYFDEMRITVGAGRYSGSSCPIPTAAFPDS